MSDPFISAAVRERLTVRNIIAVLVMAFAIGGAWADMNARANDGDKKDIEQDARHDKGEENDASTQNKLQEIQVSQARLEEGVKANQKTLERIADKLDRQ